MTNSTSFKNLIKIFSSRKALSSPLTTRTTYQDIVKCWDEISSCIRNKLKLRWVFKYFYSLQSYSKCFEKRNSLKLFSDLGNYDGIHTFKILKKFHMPLNWIRLLRCLWKFFLFIQVRYGVSVHSKPDSKKLNILI